MDLVGYRRVLLPVDGKYIYQPSSGQPVSCAAAFLQRCVIAHHGDGDMRVMDLGCGNGIVGIMLGLHRPSWRIKGIDIQPDLVKLAEYNAKICGINACYSEGDIRNPETLGSGYDLIVANPPWIKMDAGIISPDRSRALARTELVCSMPDVVNACECLLSSGGCAYILYPVFRAREFSGTLKNSLLDTIEVIKDMDTDKYRIFRLIRRQIPDREPLRTRGVS